MNHLLSLTEEEYKAMKKTHGICDMEVFESLPLFGVEDAPATKISLMLYADHHGDFLSESKKKKVADKIAQTIFEKLPIKDKLEVAEYLEFVVDGVWPDEDDEDE